MARATGHGADVASPDALAGAALPLLRALVRIAEESLDATAPDVSVQQFRALGVLHDRGPQSATGLADALGISPSTMTRLISRLVRDGLVDRMVDPVDRRSVVLSTTARGTDAVRSVRAWRLARLSDGFATVPVEERAELLAAVERLATAFAPSA